MSRMNGAYTYTPYVFQGVDKEKFKIYPNISENSGRNPYLLQITNKEIESCKIELNVTHVKNNDYRVFVHNCRITIELL